MAKSDRTYAKRARRRQQRWRKRRQAQGMRSLTVMVSAETKTRLDREKDRTGETLAQVVERAVAALGEASADPEQIPVRIRTDGETLSVQIPISRVHHEPPNPDPPANRPLSADALLQHLIAGKRRP